MMSFAIFRIFAVRGLSGEFLEYLQFQSKFEELYFTNFIAP